MGRAAVYIDQDLHRQIKIKCVEQGITLTEYLNEIVRKVLNAEKENE